MRQWDEIQRIVMDRYNAQSPVFSRMREVLKRYEGDWVVPIAERPDEPQMPNTSPLMIGQIVDFAGKRAASIKPMLRVPPLRNNTPKGTGSTEWAGKRRRALEACYDFSKYSLSRRRQFRHLAAYHTYAQLCIPDFKAEMPRLEVREPLATLTDARSADNFREPEWFATVTALSGEALRARFPTLASEYGGPVTNKDTSQMWYMVEFVDAECLTFGLLGPQTFIGDHINRGLNAPAMHCQIGPQIPNRAGMVPGTMPVNMSLAGIAAGLGSLLGSVDLQSKLTNLDILAQQRAIFPDMYVLGREGAQPRLVYGDWKPGTSGEINLIADAQTVGLLHQSPDPRTQQLIDRLERNVKTSGGLPPQAAGETYGALRTGRAIDALGGMSVDPTIQEMHEIDEAWLQYMNRVILATYKGYFGSKKYSIAWGSSSDEALLDFVPAKHIESTTNVVRYPIPGADVTQTTQIQGSLFGAGIISADTFREGHPWIEDAEREKSKILVEQIERGTLEAFQMQMGQGQIPLPMVGMVMRHVQAGLQLWEALEKAQEELQRQQMEMQQRQQAIATTGVELGMGEQLPESMPGMAAGPAALMPGGAPPQAEAPNPPVVEPTDVAKMQNLMSAMGGGVGR